MFEIDWLKLIRRDVPFAVRKPRLLAWLAALISPIIALHNRFLNFRRQTLLDLKVTGQVRILRFYLNERFDLGNERITITDGDDNARVFVFLESENEPLHLPTFLSGSTIDFIVNVPSDLQGLDYQIRAFLDQFKLASKRYRINYITPPPVNQGDLDDG